MNLKVTTNQITRETTVTATDAQGHFLCCETQAGTGARLAARLSEQVRVAAEKLQRQAVVTTAATTSERRLLSTRLA
jgi:hypothetical protein